MILSKRGSFCRWWVVKLGVGGKATVEEELVVVTRFVSVTSVATWLPPPPTWPIIYEHTQERDRLPAHFVTTILQLEKTWRNTCEYTRERSHLPVPTVHTAQLRKEACKVTFGLTIWGMIRQNLKTNESTSNNLSKLYGILKFEAIWRVAMFSVSAENRIQL